MKKVLSILLSAIMVFSCAIATTSVAYAAVVKSPSQISTPIEVNVSVNGGQTNDISYEIDDEDNNKITFTYDGDGSFTGWSFYDNEGNLLVEGVDYEVVYDDGNGVITIQVADGIESITADAEVDEGEEEEPTEGKTPDEGTTEKETTTKETTTKANKNSTSPQTGAVSAAGLAVAGAGAAILVALKKKDDAE
jgi:hypothetical protein